MESNHENAVRLEIQRPSGGGRRWRTWIRGIRAAAAVILLLSSGGCSIVRVLYAPQFTEHKSITLTVRRDTTMVAAVDTTAAQAPQEAPAETPTGESTRPRHGASPHPAATADTTAALRRETPEQPSITPAPAPPSVSIALPEAQRERLERLTRAEMGIAERITTQIAPRLKSRADLEKLKTVRGLIEQTHAALDRDDIQSAANLAHKAKLLATELLSH